MRIFLALGAGGEKRRGRSARRSPVCWLGQGSSDGSESDFRRASGPQFHRKLRSPWGYVAYGFFERPAAEGGSGAFLLQGMSTDDNIEDPVLVIPTSSGVDLSVSDLGFYGGQNVERFIVWPRALRKSGREFPTFRF